ncbi:Hypothetical_protein [Hexamita inflata]|uniref:Hypothetical_protein n=1 Tax=Hexamita inflata TaxID=28002 RepID=A0AA86P3Q8_9EUKA|nr:Hypothetical protein HINF_LOCUS17257 [Hexamita inflata]
MFLLLIIAGYFPAQKPEISQYLQTPSKTYTFSQQNWEMLSLSSEGQKVFLSIILLVILIVLNYDLVQGDLHCDYYQLIIILCQYIDVAMLYQQQVYHNLQ